MTNTPSAIPTTSAATKQAVHRDIRAKWDKFSEAELDALKDRDDLVTQVALKYGQDKSLVQRDVDALLRGRAV